MDKRILVGTDNKHAIIEKIANKYSLELLLLFGSRAAGTAYKGSDFDVAYFSEENLTLEDEARLINDLIPVFKSENVDLVNLKKAPPLLFFAVFQKCQVLFEKKPLIFATLRAYSFKRYVETKPLYKEKFARLKEKIR